MAITIHDDCMTLEINGEIIAGLAQQQGQQHAGPQVIGEDFLCAVKGAGRRLRRRR